MNFAFSYFYSILPLRANPILSLQLMQIRLDPMGQLEDQADGKKRVKKFLLTSFVIPLGLFRTAPAFLLV